MSSLADRQNEANREASARRDLREILETLQDIKGMLEVLTARERQRQAAERLGAKP